MNPDLNYLQLIQNIHQTKKMYMGFVFFQNIIPIEKKLYVVQLHQTDQNLQFQLKQLKKNHPHQMHLTIAAEPPQQLEEL